MSSPLRSTTTAATGPNRVGRWIWRGGIAAAQCMALVGLAVAELVVGVLTVAGIVLTFTLGMVFLFPFVTERFRGLTNLRRRLARELAGVQILEPYQPRPPAPIRNPDGTFQDDGLPEVNPAVHRRIAKQKLYHNDRDSLWGRRFNWLFHDPATWRDLGWMLVDPVIGGVMVLVPAVLILYGLPWLLLPWIWGPLNGILTAAPVDLTYGWDIISQVAPGLGAVPAPAAIPLGLTLTAVSIAISPRVLRIHALWSRTLLAPTESALLAQRVRRLAKTRADATDTQAAEVRRIERDLHDGAQARLVAMGMTLGAVEQLIETNPQAARALVAKTRENSEQALTELRDLVRGIHPPVLAERGLGDAIRVLAMDSPLKVDVQVDLPDRLDPPVESAAYFALNEVLANAAKHGDAQRVSVDLRYEAETLRAMVTDDGDGGADPARGSGLRGIERRLGTFDGILAISSPVGGPTIVTMEIPCPTRPGSSSPRTSTSSETA